MSQQNDIIFVSIYRNSIQKIWHINNQRSKITKNRIHKNDDNNVSFLHFFVVDLIAHIFT